jgi:hypothetical protein
LAASAGCGFATNLATLIFRGATPNASVLVGLKSKVETFQIDRALAAHRFGLCDLQESLASGANRKKEFGIGISTSGLISPGVVGASKS